ncbi:MAG: hypothetical protein M3Y85_08460, partial [Bacteroidota bacterium]|nr:hypothetical protein [Bacteroidota bacterium]
ELKKAFYEDRLAIGMNDEANSQNKFIAPMSLLVLVEHCFERLKAIADRRKSIYVDTVTIDSELYFKIKYSRYQKDEADEIEKSYWSTLLKSIEMFYSDSNSFEIFSVNGITTVEFILKTQETTMALKAKKLVHDAA